MLQPQLSREFARTCACVRGRRVCVFVCVGARTRCRVQAYDAGCRASNYLPLAAAMPRPLRLRRPQDDGAGPDSVVRSILPPIK